MKVSVIMCAYNVEAFIERAINSIVTQTYQDWELIISNDASTDNTVMLVNKYLHDKRIRLVDHQKNHGYVKNKNMAFGYATGDLVTQLDADDTCPPDRLEKQVNVFRTHPEIIICGTNFQQIDLSDKPLPHRRYEHDFLISEIADDYPFWFPGLMFRKKLIDEFGLFSEYFSGIYGDDNYWTVRVNRKYPIYFLKDVLYNYRINPDSLTNVHDNPRKMIVSEIVQQLTRQQIENGTDWLEQGNINLMQEYEAHLMNNRKLMGERYRQCAAKSVDKNDLPRAKEFLKKAFAFQKTNIQLYRTYAYYLQKKMHN